MSQNPLYQNPHLACQSQRQLTTHQPTPDQPTPDQPTTPDQSAVNNPCRSALCTLKLSLPLLNLLEGLIR